MNFFVGLGLGVVIGAVVTLLVLAGALVYSGLRDPRNGG